MPAKRQGRGQGLQKRFAGTEHRRRAQHQFAKFFVQLSGTIWPAFRYLFRSPARVVFRE